MIRRIAGAAFASLALVAAAAPVAAANEAEQDFGRSHARHTFNGVGNHYGWETIRPREDDGTIRPREDDGTIRPRNERGTIRP